MKIYIENEYNVSIKFMDNAGGIEEDILKEIFEPFVRNKESSGVGIGLNIAKTIVEEQDGLIKAYNEGCNAVFEVMLPTSQY